MPAADFVVPGFNDAHVHFIAGAEELVGVELRSARDEARHGAPDRRSRDVPPGEWITGGYWDHEAWPGARLPTRPLLDEAAPNSQCSSNGWTVTWRWRTREALRRAGVHEEFVVPAGGAVVRDADGRLTGLLKDTAMDVVTRAIPPLAGVGLLTRARAALRHAAELGVTSIQDMTASGEEFSAYEALLASRRADGADLVAMQNYDDDYASSRGPGSDWLARRGRKFFSDGSMGASTALSSSPTRDDPGNSKVC